MKNKDKDIDALMDHLTDTIIAKALQETKEGKLPISKEYVKNILLEYKDLFYLLDQTIKRINEVKAKYIEGNCQDKNLKQLMDKLLEEADQKTHNILTQVNLGIDDKIQKAHEESNEAKRDP